LPYGSSVLESARRIWRQLILAEDAMLVYRIIRSPERRVFYIDVGNAMPGDVPNIIEQARTTLKSQEVVDKTAGRVDLRYNPYSVDIDYFLPVRGTETGTRIDTLPGGANTTAIEDVEYIQKKLFAALKVPKAYLGFEEALSSKSNLAQEDIRFSRAIQQIQSIVISEFSKIAQVHLFANGYRGEDLSNFRIQLSNPSTMAQLQKLEILEKQLQTMSTAVSLEGAIPEVWMYKNILDMTDPQIEKTLLDRKNELIFKAKLEKLGTPDGEGGGGLGGGGGGGMGGGGGGGLDFGIGDEGGDDELGDDAGSEEAGEAAGDEIGTEPGEEEDLFASNSRIGPLLSDAEDEVLTFSETEKGEYKPVHQQNQVTRYKHNNMRPSRKKHKSLNGFRTPNPADAMSFDDKHFSALHGKKSIADVFDRHARQLDKAEENFVRLSKDVENILDSFSKHIDISKGNKNSIISESTVEVEIEDEE